MFVVPCPILALFGVPSDVYALNKPQCDFLAFCTLLARRLILLKWKDAIPPSHSQWVRSILLYMRLEKIKYTLRGSTSKFNEIWQPFLGYIEEKLELQETF